MGALIYNSQTGVFEDAETPKSKINGSWADTVGMNYDTDEAAWAEDWPGDQGLYIVKDDVMQEPFMSASITNNGTFTYNSNRNYFAADSNGGNGSVLFINSYIDLSPYKYLLIDYERSERNGGGSYWNCTFGFIDSSDNQKIILILGNSDSTISGTSGTYYCDMSGVTNPQNARIRLTSFDGLMTFHNIILSNKIKTGHTAFSGKIYTY